MSDMLLKSGRTAPKLMAYAENMMHHEALTFIRTHIVDSYSFCEGGNSLPFHRESQAEAAEVFLN